ncbi:MAG TPA: hypothetical protein VGH28_02075 [Polyangiaceae bacterium]|jgi:hypothetical protein
MRVMIATLLALASCSGNPLDGTWDGPSTSVLGTTYHAEVEMNGDATLSYSLVGTGSCNGTLLYTGYTWASDAVLLTFSGTPTCTGAITCGALSYDCSAAGQASALGSCDYVFSNGNDTLTTSGCTNATLNTTWTRSN